ncbi:MAG: branched chain amino acid aminotransferase, partial [Cyclobacteriaceae bacterium]|nr:branched chain amino acid aminotransferase [Cyclobacteriaceae bacterium]
IEKIQIQGKDYLLPSYSSHSFSKKVLAALDGIKYGELADPHSWIIKI